MKHETLAVLIAIPPLAAAALHKEGMLQRGAKLVWNIVLRSRWVLLALMMISGTRVEASTISVTSTSDGGPGSLRQAIASALSGDTITFYLPPNSSITLTSGELLINKSLTINGPGANQLRVERSSDPGTLNFRIFHITGNINVTISGLTIANGNAPGPNSNDGGGGILNNGANLTIANSIISKSTTFAFGGGIYNVGGGALTITNSTLSGNHSDKGPSGAGGIGGGIFNEGGGALTITNSTISGNSANNNTGNGTGGGIDNQDGPLTINNSTVSGNSATLGGGIYNVGATLTITNSTISGNTAVGAGGGISHFGSTLNVRNTIVAKNTAPTGPDCSGALTSQGFNLIGNNKDAPITPTTGDQIGTAASPINPKLGDLRDNGGPTETHALLSDSPAIDGGHSSGSRTDQRGLARPVDDPGINNASGGDGADIGAYEVQADQLPGCNTISHVVSNNDDSGVGSLRAVIASVCAGQTITFANNVRGAINLTSAELVINKSLTINGPGANLLGVRRSSAGGIPEFRIFSITDNFNGTINGLTIANGKVSGLFNPGGGILNGGTLTLTNSTISGNSAEFGGGGISNVGTVRISDSTISDNKAGSGGGISTTVGTVTITNSTISDNEAGSGGGISGGTVDVTNSTISGNMAHSGDAGGISNFGTLTLTNSTISSNTATGNGGGVLNSSGTVRARNTIIALNTAVSGPDVQGPLTSENFNLIGDSAGATISPAQLGDQIGVTAAQLNLDALRNNGGPTQTHALLSGSVAIDQGHSSGATTDQRGFNRPFDDAAIGNANGGDGDGADIGAFEFTPNPTPTPSPTPTATPTPAPGSLGNVSTRLQVGTGNNVLFAGFIIQGNASKTVLIRSAGPSLTPFGVPGALGNPQLELHDANNTIATNDDWQTTQIGGVITSGQVTAIQNSGAPPLDPAEPAIIATLPAGGYTAIVQGVGGTQGVATVEVYDLSQNNGALLANISTRGFIQTGDNVMIGGFIIVGTSSKVLIRATGPSLVPFGVNNALANPRLELHDGNGTLAGNDDWQTTQIGGIIASDQSAAIQNSGLAPSNPAESAIIATLAPGNYTAIAQGVNGGTGVGLIEVFALP